MPAFCVSPSFRALVAGECLHALGAKRRKTSTALRPPGKYRRSIVYTSELHFQRRENELAVPREERIQGRGDQRVDGDAR
jgi:hypothetical protein